MVFLCGEVLLGEWVDGSHETRDAVRSCEEGGNGVEGFSSYECV